MACMELLGFVVDDLILESSHSSFAYVPLDITIVLELNVNLGLIKNYKVRSKSLKKPTTCRDESRGHHLVFPHIWTNFLK